LSRRPRVVVLRGHHANIGELRPWEHLLDRFDVEVVTTARADQSIEGLGVPWRTAATRRARLPRGRFGTLATHAIGDAYLDIEALVRGAAIVHTAELGPWFAAQPARVRRRYEFRLVVTVWETIPSRSTFRTARAAANRRAVLAETDLFLPTTGRARRCLLLEGVPEERIQIVEPGIDVARFAAGPAPALGASSRGHLILSPGRLVWEKGHYDVLRALAATGGDARLLIVGAGPDRQRLLRYADDLGLGGRVEIRAVAYDEMPSLFARASCVVLASLPTPSWEEQFGLVLAEALAAGAPIVASSSGAIPEVLRGSGAPLFAPGDWPELARLLEGGPLARPPGERAPYPTEVVQRYSTYAAAARLAAAYERVLAL
jgi:glycosyltransferase involved in cell wall biosynthesis